MKRQNFDKMYARLSKKRTNGKTEKAKEEDYITVQLLSAAVEGKAQKYSRIGALTIVPMEGKERFIKNIKRACLLHFALDCNTYDCDLVAGERGPSYFSVGQISNWKVLHVGFVESRGKPMPNPKVQCSRQAQEKGKGSIASSIGGATTESLYGLGIFKPFARGLKQQPHAHPPTPPPSEALANSITISDMIKLGELIPTAHSKKLITLKVETFDVEKKPME